MSDGHIPNVRGVRVHVSTSYNHREGNRLSHPNPSRHDHLVVADGRAGGGWRQTYEEERHTALKEDIASAIAMSKHVMEKGTFKVLWRNLGLFLSRMTMGDLWSVRNRHGKAVNSGLPYVSGGFTIPRWVLKEGASLS